MTFIVVTGYDSTLHMQLNAANRRYLHLLFGNVNRSLAKEEKLSKIQISGHVI